VMVALIAIGTVVAYILMVVTMLDSKHRDRSRR